MGYDPRKAAWDRIVSAAEAPRGVYVRIEDGVCRVRANGAEVEVDPGLAAERGAAAWSELRATHPELWVERKPRARSR